MVHRCSSLCMKSHVCKASFLMSAMVLLAFNGQKVDQTDWDETGRWQVVGGTLSKMDQNKQNGRSRACSMCSDNGLKLVTKLWRQQTCIKYIIMFCCLGYCHVFFFIEFRMVYISVLFHNAHIHTAKFCHSHLNDSMTHKNFSCFRMNHCFVFVFYLLNDSITYS